MKLLIITPLYPPQSGGPATVAKFLQGQLGENGMDVTVLKFSDYLSRSKFLRYPLFFWACCKAIKSADVVLTLDQIATGLPATLANLIWRRPLVLRVPGDYAWEQGRLRFGVTGLLDEFAASDKSRYRLPVRVLWWLQSWVARRASRVVAQNQHLQEIIGWWGVPAERITIIPNAFDPQVGDLPDRAAVRRSLGIDQASQVIFSAGRLVQWKGMDTLINILPELGGSPLRQGSGVQGTSKLYIAGDGPEYNTLQSQIDQAGLGDQVTLLGRLDRQTLFQYIRAADVFVLNTGYEGISNQLLEVMSIGTPIVTTDVCGNPEVVQHEHSGLLVPYNDAQALQAAIERVLAQPKFAQTLTDQAKTKLADFDPQVVVEKYVQLLNNVQ